MGYFLINEDVVDRDDLSLEEKMACVVLARFADLHELDNLLSLDIIALKMGCSINQAQEALDGLRLKRILKLPRHSPSAVLSKAKAEVAPSYIYQRLDFENPVSETASPVEKSVSEKEVKHPAKSRRESTGTPAVDVGAINKIKDYFEEIISESSIKLLLNLAGGDVQKILRTYDLQKHHPANLRLEKVADALQENSEKPKGGRRSDAKAAPDAAVPDEVLDALDAEALFKVLEPTTDLKQLNQQINVKRIKQMYTSYPKK